MPDTIERSAELLAGALVTVAEVFDQADDDIVAFVEELGYILPFLPPSLKQLEEASQNLVAALADLEQRRLEADDGGGSEAEMAAALGLVILHVGDLVARISNLRTGLAGELPTAFVATTGIANDFETRLFDYVVWNALDRRAPVLRAVLTFLGIVESIPQEEDTAVHRPPFDLKRVRWERLTGLLSDPGAVFGDVYGWGTPSLDSVRLFETLTDLSVHFLGAAEIEYPTSAFIGNIAPGVVIDTVEGPEPRLRVPVITHGPFTLDLIVYPVAKSDPGELQSLALTMAATGDLMQRFPIAERLYVELDTSIELALGLALVFQPGGPVRVVQDVLGSGPASPVAAGQALLRAIYGTLPGAPDATPIRILALPGGSYLEVSRIHAAAGLGLVAANEFDGLLEAGIGGGVFSLNASNLDGFLSSILPGDGIRTEFDIAVSWTRRQGLTFKGSGSLATTLPIHIEFGPIRIDSLHLMAGLSDSRIPLEISSGLSAKLGPLGATVDRLGVQLLLAFPGSGGNAGPVDLEFKFKPPNGVGLAVNAGVVKGGGYLFLDFDREEYAGALELVFSEWIALKAIGLITTRMPDGSKGFSLLIIITVEFGSGIQLGFGFTLIGVGGLLGLHRIARVEPLTEGVRTGAIESVMFPKDVIANAPRIISDLRQFFPPQQEVFLVGPMAKIGWGTPTLVSVQLGVILEFPSVNITILGVVRVVLPDEKADVLRLQVNFIGRIEPSNKRLWFFAQLFDSRVLFITIEGGFGLLINWGGNANFVISAGGFHPRYNPPALPFPEPPRIAVSLLNESYARVRIQGYFAVTSNSVQFGARVEVFFGLSEFCIEGHLAFDALFQFDPFFFSFSLSVSLSVKVFGVGLFSVGFSGLLEGPTPWFIQGKGKIKLLFFKISVPFEHKWGRAQDTTLDPIEVYPLLEKEFGAVTNWQAEVPANNRLLVSLRELGDADPDRLVLHPVGRLLVSQRKVPVNFRLDKVGNQKPADYEKLVVSASLPGGEALSVTKLEEQFAIGQFRDLNGSSKLSSPGFEPLESGIAIGMPGEQIRTSRAVRRVIRYETIIIDTAFRRHVKSFFRFFMAGYAVVNDFLFGHFLTGNSASQSVLSKHHRNRLQPFDEVVTVTAPGFTVVSTADNRPLDGAAATFTSQAAAVQFMEDRMSADGALAGRLHVVPNTEVNIGP